MCPIVFQGHLSNFKVTRDKKLPILAWIGRFRTVTSVWIHRGVWYDAQSWCNVEEVLYNCLSSSIKFQGHVGWKINNLDPIWVRLLGRLQLSNPSDLPCFYLLFIMIPLERRTLIQWNMNKYLLFTCIFVVYRQYIECLAAWLIARHGIMSDTGIRCISSAKCATQWQHINWLMKSASP